MADVVVVNKVDAAAERRRAARSIDAVRALNPRARIVRTASPPRLDDAAAVRGKRVLVVEDGPTITHGGMAYGAGFVAATRAGVGEIVDPRAQRRAGDRRGLRALPAHRPRAAGDGLRRRAARGAAPHDRGLRGRGRGLGHADRPRRLLGLDQARRARALRARGGRRAGARRDRRRVRSTSARPARSGAEQRSQARIDSAR